MCRQIIFACCWGLIWTSNLLSQTEVVSFVAADSGETVRVNGGLIGPLGSYQLLGLVELRLHHDTGLAYIESDRLVLQGQPATPVNLDGTPLSERFYHPLTSLTGTFQDPGHIEFLKRTDPDDNDITCPIVDGQFVCDVNVSAHMFTRFSMESTTDEEATFSAFSDYFGAFDAGSVVVSATRFLRWLPGDFDLDGQLSVNDIDTLGAAIRTNDPNPIYDVWDDGVLNSGDIYASVTQHFDTYVGDVDLDGIFGTHDLVLVFQAAEFEDDIVGNSTWATGDWDQDGEFNSSDFVFAFNNNGCFDGNCHGPRPALSHSVPEPRFPPCVLFACLLGLRRHLGEWPRPSNSMLSK